MRTCPVYQLVKLDHRKKAGVLYSIPLPERKWLQITTDLVSNLPKSDKKTAIAVFVDRLSKMVHFAPCTKEISTEKCSQIFINYVSSITLFRKLLSLTEIQCSPAAF